MCECLCSEIRGDCNLRLAGGTDVVSLDLYMGCAECAPLLGVDVRVFNEKGAAEWLQGIPIQDVEGDEYGHLPSYRSFEIISVEDMKTVASDLPDVHEYSSLCEWLCDHGLTLLQESFRLARQRESGREVQ